MEIGDSYLLDGEIYEIDKVFRKYVEVFYYKYDIKFYTFMSKKKLEHGEKLPF